MPDLEASSLTYTVCRSGMTLPSATFDALKSFIVLAETRNLSETVRLLGLTRQTIRRHIKLLEELRGRRMLSLDAGAYKLTADGMVEYQAARQIFDNVCSWAQGLASVNPFIELRRFEDAKGRYFYSQQHGLRDLMSDGLDSHKQVFRAWTESRGEIDTVAFERVKSMLLLYREQFQSWLCVHVGERSAMAKWLGPVWAKSVIGSVLEQDPVANPSDEFVARAYQQVMQTGSCRYDHLAIRLPHGTDGELEAINYRRLLLPCSFPDGSPALAVCSVFTNDIDIGLLEGCKHDRMAETLVME
jgi:hypothetical protein